MPQVPGYALDRFDRCYALLLEGGQRLAEAAAEIKMRIRNEEGGIADEADGAWLKDAQKTLLNIAEEMPYQAIAHDGTLTEFAQNVATLEGWAIFNGGDGNLGHIERDDELSDFPDDAAAIAHVQQRAEAGSKLHQIALAIHTRDGKEPA